MSVGGAHLLESGITSFVKSSHVHLAWVSIHLSLHRPLQEFSLYFKPFCHVYPFLPSSSIIFHPFSPHLPVPPQPSTMTGAPEPIELSRRPVCVDHDARLESVILPLYFPFSIILPWCVLFNRCSFSNRRKTGPPNSVSTPRPYGEDNQRVNESSCDLYMVNRDFPQ